MAYFKKSYLVKSYRLNIGYFSLILFGLTLFTVLITFYFGDYNKIISGFTAIATPIAAIATVITALFIYCSLNEMEEQRKALILPTLSIPKKMGFSIVYTDQTYYGQFEYSEISDENIQNIKDSGIMTLYNLGCGSAKNITWSWFYDFEVFFKNINKYNIYNMEIGDSIMSCWIGDRDSFENFCGFSIEDIGDNHINFILPFSQDPTPIYFRVSSGYSKMVGLYFNVINQAQKPRIQEEIPPLVLKMSFEDISGNIYSKKFKFTVFTYAFKRRGDKLQQVFGGFQLIEESIDEPKLAMHVKIFN